MSGRYLPYPAYRNSGNSRIGEVPKDWNLRQLKRSVEACVNGIWGTDATGGPDDIVVIRVADFDRQKLSLLDGDYTVRRVTEKERGRRLLQNGDLLLEKSGGGEKTPVGQVVVFRKQFAAVCSNFVAKMSPNEGYSAEYLNYAFSSLYADGINTCSIKQNTGIQNLDSSAYLAEHWPFPPLSEQVQIARFLDYETAKIDALIEKQQQLIALLKEKRQAVISHTVTKGLNPNAPLRDSGVEWLGMVPAHWAVHALRFCAKDGHKTFTDGDWVESPFITESGVRLLQTGNVGIGEFREKGFRYISDESFHRLNCTEIFSNDVLICRLDGPVGRACLTPDLGVRMVTSVDNAILKTSNDFDPRFIVYTMSSTEWISWIENICRAGGGFRFRVSRSMLGSQRVPAPPVEEQRRIADFLDEGRSRHDTLVNRAEETIELLQERRTALISAAVTGKIDVRGWAPQESKVEQEVA